MTTKTRAVRRATKPTEPPKTQREELERWVANFIYMSGAGSLRQTQVLGQKLVAKMIEAGYVTVAE